MKPVDLKVARIGNSRGVRIPAATLSRYHIGASVVMEERSDGILLRPRGAASPKLSFLATAVEMATASEDWTKWDIATGDGLDDLPWQVAKNRQVAEPKPTYVVRRRQGAR